MKVIKFGKWNYYAGKFYTFKRIYIRGYIWTPLCIMELRKYARTN